MVKANDTDETRDLEGENARLRRLLDASTAKIMKLQGTADTTDQITDVEIGKSVEALQDAIQWWINSVEKHLRNQGQNFRDIFRRRLARDGCFIEFHAPGLYGDVRSDTGAEWMTWLGNLSTCIYVVLGRAIWDCLQAKIFSRTFPIGVYGHGKLAFQDIFSAMRRDGKDQDSVTLANKWRSDTMTSFTKTERFKRLKEDHLERLSSELEGILDMWIEEKVPRPHFKSFHEKVVHEAVELHQKMTCSSYEFLVETPESSDLVRGQIPHDSTLSDWTLKDMVKWRPPYGGIAGVFMCLSPGIYRLGLSGKEKVLAAQPVVLVYDHSAPEHLEFPHGTNKGSDETSAEPSVQESPPRIPQRSPQRNDPRRH